MLKCSRVNEERKKLFFNLKFYWILGGEEKYKITFKTFFSLINPTLKLKKRDKSRFWWFSLLFKYILIEIQSNISEQEKKRQIIYGLLNAETNPKKFPNKLSLFMASIKSRPLNYAVWEVLERKKI